jgi:hypothetical protein
MISEYDICLLTKFRFIRKIFHCDNLHSFLIIQKEIGVTSPLRPAISGEGR